jgi:hypothetical protein
MKKIIWFVMWLVGCLTVFGEIDERRMERLERYVKIDSVREATMRNDDLEKIEVLKINTSQDERDIEGFYIRVTVELTDRSKNTFYAQLMRPQAAVSSEYMGQDRWEFHVPQGKLERPKVSAYVVEYGIMDEGTFVPFATELDDVDSLKELTDRSETRIEDGVKLMHAYYYRDTADESQQSSILRTLR